MKITVSLDVAPCSVVEVGRRFRGANFVVALMMEAVRTSEMSVCFNEITRLYSLESCHLQALFQ
jgi:hypothetical protein